MVDPVEKLLQVHVHDDGSALRHVLRGLMKCVVRASSRPEAVAGVRKGRVHERLEHLEDRLLHQPVDHRWDAQLSHPAARFGDFHPADRLRSVTAVEERRDQFLFVLDDPVGRRGDGHPIDARRAPVRLHLAIRSVQVVTVGHLLHQSFGQGTCWAGRRERLLLLARGRSGSALAALAVARTLRTLLEEKTLVKLALLLLRAHRDRSDCSLHPRIRPFVGE